jgi:hypothetical protein
MPHLARGGAAHLSLMPIRCIGAADVGSPPDRLRRIVAARVAQGLSRCNGHGRDRYAGFGLLEIGG